MELAIQIAIWALGLLALLILYRLVAQWAQAGSSRPAPRPPRREPEPRGEIGAGTRVASPPPPPEQEFAAEGVTVLDLSDKTLESPEGYASEVDAMLVDLIRQAFELPTAILQLSNLLRDPEVTVRDAARIVGTDPVLSSRILRIANSAAVGKGKVTSLHKAIVLLGFNQVWILVNQMLTSRALKPVAELDEESMKMLWRHGAATAVCAKHVLGRIRIQDPNYSAMAMTCALLHDIGKFLLRSFRPIEVPEETPQAKSVLDLEKEQYQVTHTKVGYLLATYWKLPEEICTVIGYHHHPSCANHGDIPPHVRRAALVVSYADYIASASGYWESAPVALKPNDEAMAQGGTPPPYGNLITPGLLRELAFTDKLLRDAYGQ